MSEALVLVHGYLGGSAQWAAQVAAFSPFTRTITPDLPGFGANSGAVAPDTIRGFAEYVLDDVSSRGVDRFHLLGHSMGGMIVQQMIALAPERVDRLVLYGTGPIGALPGRFEPIAESARRVREEGVETTGRRIAATWFADFAEAPNYPVCADLAVQASEQAALAGLTAMQHWSGEDALKAIRAPTLVLWGDLDRAYQWSQVERLWRTIEGASLAVVPGCSHVVHLEKPGYFNALVGDFLFPEKTAG